MLREFVTSRPTIQEMLKGFIKDKMKGQQKTIQRERNLKGINVPYNKIQK